MTKRRKPGEVVLKPAAAGFIMGAGYARTHYEHDTADPPAALERG